MCSVLGVSVSAYYDWEGEQVSAHERRDSELSEVIRALFTEFHGRYGAPRIQYELAKRGCSIVVLLMDGVEEFSTEGRL